MKKRFWAHIGLIFFLEGLRSLQAQDATRIQEGLWAESHQAWHAKDWPRAEAALQGIKDNLALAPQIRSIAHLRLARALVVQKRLADAAQAYRVIAAEKSYPEIHRYEATECLKELRRLPQGKSAPPTHYAYPKSRAPGRIFYVKADAPPTGDGSKQAPFPTLESALAKTSQLDPVPGGTTILLAAGRYVLPCGITLPPELKTSAESPLIIRSAQPGKAVLFGGRTLQGFSPVTDPTILSRLPEESRGKVVQCDLKAQGIHDYATLGIRGWAQGNSPPTLELFANGQAQTLARWPNQGFVSAGPLLEPGTPEKSSAFGYLDDRHARWTTAPDGWIFGFFRHRWADCTLPIGRIDTAQKSLTTAVRYSYGMSDKEGIIYYAFNLLEEIDQPGEWYLDRQLGKLYWYPSVDPKSADIGISMLAEPLLAGKNLQHIHLEGLVLDTGRSHGIQFTDSSDVRIVGCTVRKMGSNGIVIQGGFRNHIVSCDIHTIGRRGTEIIGGDRPTLTPGRHQIVNSRIRDFGRIDRTYTPAVQLEGVGNRVAHCHFEKAPSSAMRLEGNDHLVECNEFRRVVLESDDQGAVDIYTSPSYRGIVFRYNAFIDIGDGAKQHAGQGGIRFDDIISGMTVYSNIFLRTGRGFGGVQMNCGKDNIIDNNLFIDCPIAVSGGYGSWNPSWERHRGTDLPPEFILNDLYRNRYPALAKMYETPNVNYLWRNGMVRCGQEIAWPPEAYDRVAQAVLGQDPGFVKDQEIHRQIPPEWFDAIGMRPIPTDDIGLYPDPWRKAWVDTP